MLLKTFKNLIRWGHTNKFFRDLKGINRNIKYKQKTLQPLRLQGFKWRTLEDSNSWPFGP